MLLGSVGDVTAQTATFVGSTVGGGGGTTDPAGNDTEIQINDAGAFGADSNLTWDGSTLDVTGNVDIDGTSALGPELITNGTFTGNADGWTLQADCSVYGTNNVVVTYDAGCQGSSGDPSLSQDITTVSGTVYKIAFTLSSVSLDSAYWFLTVQSTPTAITYADGSHVAFYTSTVTGTDTLTFSSFNFVNDGTWTIDDVSIRAVSVGNPLSVTGFSGFPWIVSGDVNRNLGIGDNVLSSIDISTAYGNVGFGDEALSSNVIGGENVGIGTRALFANTGAGNVGVGHFALANAATTSTSIGVGRFALLSLTSGSRNIGIGNSVDGVNISGINRIVIGDSANSSQDHQVTLGHTDITQTVLRGDLYRGTVPQFFDDAPTLTAGFGAGASVTAHNGPLAFRINVGTTAGATGTIGLPPAPTGWNCFMVNLTSRTANDGHEVIQLASTTTTVSIEEQNQGNGAQVDFSNNDILSVSCFPF
jgi:hypothetical protein